MLRRLQGPQRRARCFSRIFFDKREIHLSDEIARRNKSGIEPARLQRTTEK